MAKEKSKNYEFVSALLADKETRQSIESLPCEIFEADGAFGFRFFYGGKPGIVALEFYSHGLAEWAMDQGKTAMRATLAASIVGQPGADEYLSSEKAKEYPTDDAMLPLARIAATVFIKGMSGKFRSLLGELELETECYIRGISFKATGTQADNGVEQLAKEMATERKQFLKNSIARFGAPKWERMKAHYDELLPVVKDARDVYRANKSRDWRAMIKIGFPQLDNDIIASLSEDDNDLPEHVSRKRNEGGEDDYSKPSDLALEQAGRHCGMKPFQYAPRTLSDRLREHSTAGQPPNGNAAPKNGKTRQPARSKPAPKKLVSKQIH